MKPNFLKAVYFMLNVLKKEKLFEEKFFTADDAVFNFYFYTFNTDIRVCTDLCKY